MSEDAPVNPLDTDTEYAQWLAERDHETRNALDSLDADQMTATLAEAIARGDLFETLTTVARPKTGGPF